MPGNVVKSLLNEPVNASLVFVGNIVGQLIGVDLNGEVLGAGYLAGLPLQGGYQAQIVEHGRTKKEGHIAHDGQCPFSQVPEGLELALRIHIAAP